MARRQRRSIATKATTRITATGAAITGACIVWWMTIAPSAATTVLDISDGTASGTTIWTHSCVSGNGAHIDFGEDGFAFTSGVYVETLTDITAVTFCYSQ